MKSVSARVRGSRLPAAVLRALGARGFLSKHIVDSRFRDGRIELLHATKGWRSFSVGRLLALGVLA